jgi:hypothetical protein
VTTATRCTGTTLTDVEQNDLVKRRERERIMGQWGGRRADDDPREQAKARALEEQLEGSPVLGRPLGTRLRNFRPAAEGYVAGAVGPPAFVRRLRAIEDEQAEHARRLERTWRELAEAAGEDERLFAESWTAVAAGWSFYAVNALIAKHNRYYPVESRLPMDPRTGDFVLVNGRSYRLEPLDAGWILERYPATLDRAAAAA